MGQIIPAHATGYWLYWVFQHGATESYTLFYFVTAHIHYGNF